MHLDNFILFLNLLSGFSAIMIGLLFLTVKSKNRIANIFLVLFLWCLSWLILTDILYIFYDEELLESYPVFKFNSVLFLVPSLFLYIIITINKSLNKWCLLFFLPGIIDNVFPFEEHSLIDNVFDAFSIAINFILLILAFRTLTKHKKEVANFYSVLEQKTLSWIKSIIIIVFVLLLFSIFGEIADYFSEKLSLVFSYLEVCIVFFIVYWVGYNGFFQAQIFEEKNSTEQFEDIEITETEKPHIEEIQKEEPKIEPKDSVITEEDTSQQFKEIESKIKSQKLYRNSNLNLRDLALKLGISQRELSKLINKNTQANFFMFINRLRVDAYKNLLTSPKAKQLSNLGLAKEVGFSSKSTFYAAFKNIEGMTPKQYESTL